MFLKHIIPVSILSLVLFGAASANLVEQATSNENSCLTPDFLKKNDARFAHDCSEFVFGADSTLEGRQLVAWMLFARLNQTIEGLDARGDIVSVPKWMAWPTDEDTFKRSDIRFNFQEVSDISSTGGFVIPKHVLAGATSTADPDGSNEQVTRNKAGYDYLYDNKLNTLEGVKAYLAPQHITRIEMPIGSIEIKGSWLKSKPEFDSHFPPGTFSFEFNDGKYWFRGMHLMVKFAKLDANDNVFTSEQPSWFWTTFELNKNPGGAACTDESSNKCTTVTLNPTGTEHAREKFISQRTPFDQDAIIEFLKFAGLGDMGFEEYAPNGTQIRFTQNADGSTPVILGHTDMEDFAGWIDVNTANTHQNPAKWTQFDASCHSCHATAAYNPKTGYVYPFTVPIGKLPKNYSNTCKVNVNDGTDGKKPETKPYSAQLANGYKSLDFMWPIAFQLDFECKISKLTG